MKRGGPAETGVGAAARRAMGRLAGVVDSVAMQAMTRAFSRGRPRRGPEDRRAQIDAMIAVYGDPRLLSEPERYFVPPGAPAVDQRVESRDAGAGTEVVDLAFRSAFVPYHAPYRDEYLALREVHTVHGRMWRTRTPRPTAILLHGWGGGNYWIEERAFAVRWLTRIGLDVVLLQLPFHGRRVPPGMPAGAFPSPHVIRTNEAFAQSVSDVRALTGWLLSRGAPAVGVAGMSLGGYTTALVSTLDDRLAFAVPMIPAVDFADLLWRHGESSPARKRAEEAGVQKHHLEALFRVHSPLARPAKVAAARRLIVAGEGDRICPPDHAERLRVHWDGCAIHWFPGGHLAQVGRGAGFRAVRRLLVDTGVL